jgi:hypothetical protein
MAAEEEERGGVMKTKLLALMLFAGASAFAYPHVFIGVGFGFHPVYRAYLEPPVVAYAPPVAVAPAYIPPAPGPGFAWIAGYSYPVGAGWGWHAGYWARRPWPGAAWVGPRYFGGHFYAGYWRR